MAWVFEDGTGRTCTQLVQGVRKLSEGASEL